MREFYSISLNITFPLRWFAGEPNFLKTEHCLQMNFRNGIVGLNDIDCNHGLYFICQLDDCSRKI